MSPRILLAIHLSVFAVGACVLASERKLLLGGAKTPKRCSLVDEVRGPMYQGRFTNRSACAALAYSFQERCGQFPPARK